MQLNDEKLGNERERYGSNFEYGDGHEGSTGGRGEVEEAYSNGNEFGSNFLTTAPELVPKKKLNGMASRARSKVNKSMEQIHDLLHISKNKKYLQVQSKKRQGEANYSESVPYITCISKAQINNKHSNGSKFLRKNLSNNKTISIVPDDAFVANTFSD